jgi:hypothetical protein
MAQRTPSEVAKYASLGLVWGVIALLAFILLPWLHDGTHGFTYVGTVAQHGVGAIKGNPQGSLADPVSFLFFLLIVLIPVASIVVIVTSLIARIRPPSRALLNGTIAAAIVGIAGTLVMFVPNVANNPEDQKKFAFAAGVVVLTGVLSRIQKQLRSLFSDHPTVASLLLLIVVYAFIFSENYATFTSIIFSQSGIWLSLVAFLIATFGGYSMIREMRRARRGK